VLVWKVGIAGSVYWRSNSYMDIRNLVSAPTGLGRVCCAGCRGSVVVGEIVEKGIGGGDVGDEGGYAGVGTAGGI